MGLKFSLWLFVAGLSALTLIASVDLASDPAVADRLEPVAGAWPVHH